MGCNGDNYRGLWESIERELNLDLGVGENSRKKQHLNRGLGDKLARKGVEGKTKGSRKKFNSKEQSPETA